VTQRRPWETQATLEGGASADPGGTTPDLAAVVSVNGAYGDSQPDPAEGTGSEDMANRPEGSAEVSVRVSITDLALLAGFAHPGLGLLCAAALWRRQCQAGA
jgi:hypothetical protein